MESVRRGRAKKALATSKLTLPTELESSNPENNAINTFPLVYPNQATICMEIRRQGLSELGIDLRYHQEGSHFHPAYRKRIQATGSNFRQHLNNSNQQTLINCPSVLPGYHCSSAFRSGNFFEPETNQNFENPELIQAYSQNVEPNVYKHHQQVGRSRTYAMESLKRPNLKSSNSTHQNQNTNNNMFNYHFEGFQEGYNPNFVDNQNYSDCSTSVVQEYNQFIQMPLNGNYEDENRRLRKTNENGVGLQISHQHSSILDCNIADVIKNELEIDGSLDFI